MGYVHSIQIDNNNSFLIQPKTYAIAEGTSSALTATLSNFQLFDGTYVNIKVSVVAANATLNINGTGAFDIYYEDNKITDNVLVSDHIYTFIYSNSHWNLVGDIASSNILIGTTQDWINHSTTFPQGTILIYTDRVYTDVSGTTSTVMSIKISDGSTPCVDLPFVGDKIKNEIINHINDNTCHITAAERTLWSNKLNCEDTPLNHNLILTRN